jgi:hypothetical protein
VLYVHFPIRLHNGYSFILHEMLCSAAYHYSLQIYFEGHVIKNVPFISEEMQVFMESPWYPLDRRLRGPQSRSGPGGEEKNSQPHRESNPRTPIVQPVAQRYTD